MGKWFWAQFYHRRYKRHLVQPSQPHTHSLSLAMPNFTCEMENECVYRRSKSFVRFGMSHATEIYLSILIAAKLSRFTNWCEILSIYIIEIAWRWVFMVLLPWSSWTRLEHWTHLKIIAAYSGFSLKEDLRSIFGDFQVRVQTSRIREVKSRCCEFFGFLSAGNDDSRGRKHCVAKVSFKIVPHLYTLVGWHWYK